MTPPLVAAAFAISVAWAVASFGLEALYQRHFWFLIGAALVLARSGSFEKPSGHA